MKVLDLSSVTSANTLLLNHGHLRAHKEARHEGIRYPLTSANILLLNLNTSEYTRKQSMGIPCVNLKRLPPLILVTNENSANGRNEKKLLVTQ